jgi:DNA-directed RNA polymerase specialized sigma24 family protein
MQGGIGYSTYRRDLRSYDAMNAEGATGSPDERRLSADEVRELDEVRKALGELTTADLGRLTVAARGLLAGFQGDPRQRDHEDLPSSAVLLTLTGKRQWRKVVNIRSHLFRVMRSLSSHWRGEVDRKPDTVSLTDLESLEDHLDTPDLRPSPERMMILRQTLRAIYAHFADDAVATRVLQLMARELKGPAIRRLTGMTKRELSTTMKRIRRVARRGEYDDV